MRSIRRSLVIYFLGLIAAALGAASVLAYRTTSASLQEKEASQRGLLMAQFERRSHQTRVQFDQALVSQAHTLASLAEVQSQWNRIRFQCLAPLGLLGTAPTPSGHLLTPLWAAQAHPNRLSFRLVRMISTELQFREESLPQLHEGRTPVYFQINSEWGSTWHSASLGGNVFSFDPAAFAALPLFEPRFDEVQVGGVPARRVLLKAPVSRFRLVLPVPGEEARRHGRRGPPGPQFPASEPRISESSSLGILIHCAARTEVRDEALANLEAEHNANLESLEAESAQSLAAVRNRLLWIGLTTFAAAVAGGFALVHLGLIPLHRLSEAVSRVTPKDFRLPFDPALLPSELKPIAGRLQETLDQLKRVFSREKQAAADISHELRTPLAALLTTVEVALRKPRQPDEYREILLDCHAAAQQMSQLVERLLALARLDAGADTLRAVEVDVGELAVQCASLVRPLAEARELDLKVETSGPVVVRADPTKLREVLNNLLHNAIEYNRPHGRVSLAVGRQNGHLQVEVSDTGVGIPESACGQIFERFYRADASRHAEGLHAGLGLAIVKGYVDLMGGTIGVESQVGEGSTFRVRLPLSGERVPQVG